MEYNYQYILDTTTKQISTQEIRRLPDGSSVPNDLANIDWQAYQLWIEQGNQPLPPEGN
jgi:hypothetical protein